MMIMRLSAFMTYLIAYTAAQMQNSVVYSPKILILSAFIDEEKVWLPLSLNQDIPVPGLSSQYPNVHCNVDYSICQMTTAMGFINAATSATTLFMSPQFNFAKTYFMWAGIAGGNPELTTLGSVTFPRYTVETDLQYELDGRDVPKTFPTGYWAFNTAKPGDKEAQGSFYGSEVFEINANLLAKVLAIAKSTKLSDTPQAIAYRKTHSSLPAAARANATVIQCDESSGDVWFGGTRTSEGVGKYMKMVTNGTANYCSTAQEGSAIMTAALRAHEAGKVDYFRFFIMRVISNFDRASPGADQYKEWFLGGITTGAGFTAALNNIYAIGLPIIKDITTNWDKTYAAGIAPPMRQYNKSFGAKVDVLGTIITPLVSPSPIQVPTIVFSPKVVILCAFIFEERVWTPLKLTRNILVPGLSNQYPNVHCNVDYSVCQVTTAMGFANSATSATTLFMSPQFNFAKTYFMWAGIAGGNPELTTLGSVTFPRYTIQIDLQYELDGRDAPQSFPTGYWPFDTKQPGDKEALTSYYGSESFEINANLLAKVLEISKSTKLTDTPEAVAYRKTMTIGTAATKNATIIQCDEASGNVWFGGRLSSEAVGRYMKMVTNDKANYCATAQEGNAIMMAAMRAHKAGKVDYFRFFIMRTIADFDRASVGGNEYEQFLLSITSGAGFFASLNNIYAAGLPIIKDITSNWDTLYSAGIMAPEGAVADILGSLVTPTSMPSASPTNFRVVSSQGTPGSCFAEFETVALVNGEVKAISKVEVGDVVMAADSTGKIVYSPVVYVPHGFNQVKTIFVHISTENGHDVRMTRNHILPSGVCGSTSLPLVYASKITIGHCIETITGQEKVVSIENIESEGVYTIVTNEEFIVVNGIIASSFGTNHMMANMFYNIHRFLYAFAPKILTSEWLHMINEYLGLMIPLFGPSTMK